MLNKRSWAAAALAITVAAAAGLWWGLGGDGGIRPDPRNAELVALGGRLYGEHCAACHGARLEGQPNWRERLPNGRLPAPPHDESGHTWHHPDAVLVRIVTEGIQAVAPPGYESDMPAYGDTLSDREIAAVLSFIKSRWSADVLARQEGISRQASR